MLHETKLSPDRILQVGLGFWASKTLLSAVELRVFATLADGPRSGLELRELLQLHPRAAADFLDALVALGFLERTGSGADSLYENTPETSAFLDPAKPTYVGGILEMANARLYPFWADLSEGLRTGRPQNEFKSSGRKIWEELYADPARLEQFAKAMAGIQAGNFLKLAEVFDFSRYEHVCDVGGSTGALAIAIAHRHPEVTCTTYDLPAIEPIARATVEAAGLAERIRIASGDFNDEPLPRAHVITLGNVLHDMSEERKRALIGKAYEALPDDGVLIAIESVIDDERRHNAFGLLMSLNMLIETEAGSDYTGAQFDRWCRDAGFARTEIIPLAGPASAAVAYKS
jgi:DNA-binding MarR family transcriptional regulator/precorrin-6B methylase 2